MARRRGEPTEGESALREKTPNSKRIETPKMALRLLTESPERTYLCQFKGERSQPMEYTKHLGLAVAKEWK